MMEEPLGAGLDALKDAVKRAQTKARSAARRVSRRVAQQTGRPSEIDLPEKAPDHDPRVGELKRRLDEMTAARDAQAKARANAGAARDALLARVEDLGDVLREYHAVAPDVRPQNSGYLAIDMPDLVTLHQRARRLGDDEWVDLWVEALEGRASADAALPDFPKSDHIGWTMYPSAVEASAVRNAGIFVAHIRDLVARHGPVDWNSARVLDVGCGWGRIYRLMVREVWPPNLHGFDVDPWLVTLSKACLPPGQFSSVHPRQALPYADSSFDVLFANSVLSHLTEEEHLAAVREWDRILAPGGIVIATVISETALEVIVAANGGSGTPAWHSGVLDNIDTIRTTIAERGLGWASSGRRGSFAGYGVAFTTENWLRTEWPETLGFTELVTYADYPQSFAVGRKPG